MKWLLALVLMSGCGRSHRAAGSCDGPCGASRINHVVVLVQENHTFDDHFGRYCTAPTGSSPSCTSGPACCEAGPDRDPGQGGAPTVLDDKENSSYSPDHGQDCEIADIDNGKMDRFVSNAACGSPRNFAYALPSLMQPYWQLAASGALADRYFQPVAGASASNDMFFAVAHFVFKDNQFSPNAIGKECSFIPTAKTFDGPTVGDLLVARGVSWAWYAEGYQSMIDARKGGSCPDAPVDCAAASSIYPCVYDPSDVPFQYYASSRDNPTFIRDYALFAQDLQRGKLPQVAFVKGLGFRSEHPSGLTTLSDGVAFVGAVVAAVEASDYAADTLVLVTYDEGGGYFDHVAPPPAGSDHQPYGTRVPLLAVGPFARKNTVSHAMLEHSSIVAFLEWNWLGMQVGQLGARDATVGNLGSLLDPAATGVAIPGG